MTKEQLIEELKLARKNMIEHYDSVEHDYFEGIYDALKDIAIKFYGMRRAEIVWMNYLDGMKHPKN